MVSIAIDPDDMFDPIIGMHVLVIRFIHGIHIMDQIFGMTGKKSSIELYEPGGELGFSQDAGMKIFGGWSEPKHKNHFLFRKEVYGKGNFDYKFS